MPAKRIRPDLYRSVVIRRQLTARPFHLPQKFSWPDLANISVAAMLKFVKRLRPHSFYWVTQCKNNASAGQEAGNSINLALFQSRVQRRYFAADWLGLGTVCRFKLRFIPAQVMPEHLSHEKEIEFFALGQLYIGMAS